MIMLYALKSPSSDNITLISNFSWLLSIMLLSFIYNFSVLVCFSNLFLTERKY